MQWGDICGVLIMPNVCYLATLTNVQQKCNIILNIYSQRQRESKFIYNNSVFSASESRILLFWCLYWVSSNKSKLINLHTNIISKLAF